jgi:hypothetical protein
VFSERLLKGTNQVSRHHLTYLGVREQSPAILHRDPEIWAVVREPLQRFVSDYLYLKYKLLVPRPQKPRLEQVLWPASELGSKEDVLFDFAIFTRTVLSALRRQPMLFDQHFLPQCEFLRDIPNHRLTLGRFENLDTFIEQFQTRIGSETRMKPQMVSDKTKEEIVIDTETLTSILDFYKEDYETLGYPLPNRSGWIVSPWIFSMGLQDREE